MSVHTTVRHSSTVFYHPIAFTVYRPSRVLDLEAALEGLGAGILERYPHRRLASLLGVHGTESIFETLLRLCGLPAQANMHRARATCNEEGREGLAG